MAVFVMELELLEDSTGHVLLVPRIRKYATIMETTMRCTSDPVYNNRLKEERERERESYICLNFSAIFLYWKYEKTWVYTN